MTARQAGNPSARRGIKIAVKTMAETEDDAPNDGRQVLYRRLNTDEYYPPDTHERLNDDEELWVCDPDSRLDQLDEIDYIEVLQWDFRQRSDVRLSGPPELIIDEEDKLWLYAPDDADADGGCRQYRLGQVECQKCETVQGVQAYRGQDFQVPHECINCELQGPFLPYGLVGKDLEFASLSDPVWEPPTGLEDERYSEIWANVRSYIKRYWATENDYLYEGLAAFAISTWLRPNFDYLPHLMVMGKHETGKTRLLNTLGNICYRAINPVDASPASVFRTIDIYNTTFFLSEYHDLIEEKQMEINTLIKGAQKRGETVMRTEGEKYDPVSFSLFTHVGIGTQYEIPDDTESRCIEIQTRPANEQMPDLADAPRLRNDLAYARFRLHDSEEWDQAWERADEYLRNHGVRHRLREKLLSLVAVAVIWDELDAIKEFVVEMSQQRRRQVAETEDALVVQAMMEEAFKQLREGQQRLGDPWSTVRLYYDRICEQYEAISGRELTPSRLGHFIKRFPLTTDRSNQGTFIQQDDLGVVLRELADENNLAWESLEEDEEEPPAPAMEEIIGDLRATISDLCTPDDAAYHGDIVSEMVDRGYNADRVENKIQKLRTQGLIFEEGASDHYRLTRDAE